ncbi:MAG TPA: DUF3311 domain-containing protein [Mycobacteriales bacterium]|nr:DUF3311 domain-containing protein [Mycobacteriales bacterium]
MTQQPVRKRSDRPRLSPGALVVVVVCIAAPFVALCWVGSYAKVDPRLWGFPFFFWYQLLWVFIAAVLTYVAYRIVDAGRRSGRGGPAAGSVDSADSGEETPR